MATARKAASSREALRDLKVPGAIKFQKVGFRSYAGVMQKITFVVPFPELAERFTFDRLLSRHDFDIDDASLPGQRDITESHVRKIAEGIKKTDRPYLGTVTVAMAADQVEVDVVQNISEYIDLVMVTVRDTAENPVIEDGQHRVKMAGLVWPSVKEARDETSRRVRKYLTQTSVEMTMLLEADPDKLSTIFVKMGSTKPISPNLIAVMDKSTYQNQLGLYVTRHSALLRNRVGYLSAAASKAQAAKKGQKFEGLYPAAAVRSAVASIVGVGVRDRTPEQRETILQHMIEERARREGVTIEKALEAIGADVVALLDYAYSRIPGWRELEAGSITVPEFKRQYVHSSAAGLHVIANVIAAARLVGVDPHAAIDAMATLPWERSALRHVLDERGEKAMAHEFFEGTLAVTSYDAATGAWRAGTGGATRSMYEPAVERVLRTIARKRRPLKALGDKSTFVAVGLLSEARRGRPRKAPPAVA